MAGTDDFLYEYAVVRYVPRVDREEFINIGLIMMSKRRKWLLGKIRLDKKRLEAFDPKVDFEGLSLQASVFERLDVPRADLPVEERYRWLAAVKSAVLQVSPSHPGLLPVAEIENTSPRTQLEIEFDRLLKTLVL